MDCNNKHCYWNHRGYCCPESEEQYENAVPDTLDCPSSLRADFAEQHGLIYKECQYLLFRRSMREMIEIKKFMESQREDRS